MRAWAARLRPWAPWLGLFLVIGYWVSVHPPGFSHVGYSEDMCGDVLRQTMASTLQKGGGPAFWSDEVAIPAARTSMPFMSWSLERDWIGAWFWSWKPEFPWLWAYLGASLVASFLFVGVLLERGMRLGRLTSWGLATFLVLFNVPRHYKLWHHFEFAMQHWLYLGVFLDAWIWRRAVVERRWSLGTEAWRLLFQLGVLGTAGYYWGGGSLQWMVFRLCLLALIWRSRGSAEPVRLEWNWRAARIPAFLGVILAGIQFRWFWPLLQETRLWNQAVSQELWFKATIGRVVQPLWLDGIWNPIAARFGWPKLLPIDTPETVVTIGWLYLVPVAWGVWILRRSKGLRAALGLVAPFLICVAIAVLYFSKGVPWEFAQAVQKVVPFLIYFRTASRWGLFLPLWFGAMLVLLWPWIAARLRERWPAKDASAVRLRRWAGLFLLLSAVELSRLAVPVNAMPAPSPGLKDFYARVAASPGDRVLDLPFCLNGGNGGCEENFCPFYPRGSAPICLRLFHGKKIHGLYQARLNPESCSTYRREPFTSLFAAFRGGRCLEGAEWDRLCAYLDEYPTHAGVMIFPDLWKAAAEPSCRAQFERRLGARLEESAFAPVADRGATTTELSRVWWYPGRCLGRR
jgi:hypothetical protein